MPDINIGALSEAINDKMDRNGHNVESPSAVIIETYSNGTDWYRVWSDGWCEQGGIATGSSQGQTVTIELLVPFANTNYHIDALQSRSSTSSGCYPYVVLNSLQTTQFQLRFDSSTTNFWCAKGYIL